MGSDVERRSLACRWGVSNLGGCMQWAGGAYLGPSLSVLVTVHIPDLPLLWSWAFGPIDAVFRAFCH
jgi:hypothetical protein